MDRSKSCSKFGKKTVSAEKSVTSPTLELVFSFFVAPFLVSFVGLETRENKLQNRYNFSNFVNSRLVKMCHKVWVKIWKLAPNLGVLSNLKVFEVFRVLISFKLYV